ncbi:MAG: lipid-binding protein [Bacteroidetes bacterium GWF2_42_66]|nr:MAG: lipid-binding protein [Bacteroidetes bacterium GWA2_42_15]OFX97935.1 MAG: lipid-binding protein [Bacteroidetes bacterium GWE2_42_39]OFY45828.1 MAG: lipid-binding protein [Bacteroidetes bacterium GWF2_42_66]HBL74671.1 lipid-binding protein [Prolixibacteraceae bacterium]HCR89356.1 lipid-binding protein [Prolixibacteraceae bacterium]
MKTMKLKTVFILLIALGLSSAAFAETYKVDKTKSTVKWLGKKVTGQHNGTISFSEGALQVANGKPSGGEFVIDMNSIVDEDLTDATWNQKLVGHLKSDDFFGVEKFPTAKLVLTNVTAKGGNKYLFKGDLTIKGITHPAEFEASFSMSGNSVSAEGTLVIDRSKYDVRYGSGKFFDNLGDKTIYDDFTLDFKVVASK